MKKFLKIAAVVAGITLVYHGYQDLKNSKPKTVVASDTTVAKIDSIKVMARPTVK